MNNTAKLFTVIFVLCSMAVCLFGCTAQKSTQPSTENPTEQVTPSAEVTEPKPQKKPLSMEDIAWSVDQGIANGKRYVVLNYTNNSEYTLSNLEMTFKEKSNITQEEKSKFYSDIQTKLGASDEDIEELKTKPLSMSVEAKRVVNPGESLTNVRCHYYRGSFYVMDMEHFQLVEPDIATIQYIDENTIYTTYYDFTAKKFSPDDDTEQAYQWASSELGNKLPKPDVKVVENHIDSAEIFTFEAFGLSPKQFDAYVEQCKQMGYTVQAQGHDNTYMAKDAEGYEIYLWFDDDKYSMRCSVKTPENVSTTP